MTDRQHGRTSHDWMNLLSLTPFFVGVGLWTVTVGLFGRYMGDVGVGVGVLVGLLWIVLGMDVSEYLAKRWNVHD